MIDINTSKEFTSWFIGMQKIYDNYMHKNFPNIPVETFTIKQSRKFIKIIRGTSVHCFIERETGNVLKAASWKAPAKGTRGNIFNEDNGLNSITPYSVAYLR
jgi:hypothetical protein